MKRKDITALHQLTTEQLTTKAQELRMELAKLQLEKSTGKLDNPRLVSSLRDDLARVLTILGEKEVTTVATSAPVAKQ